MQVTAALIGSPRAQVAVVLVRAGIATGSRRDQISRQFNQMFDLPVVLAEQSGRSMRYWGPADIVRQLKRIPWTALPWGKYSLSRTA